MENKQTAVEWLVEELTNQNMFMHLFAKEIEKAKQIEKKQIIEAAHSFMGTNFDSNMGRAELYYNDTYGNGKI